MADARNRSLVPPVGVTSVADSRSEPYGRGQRLIRILTSALEV
jgi:hypothetical protein